MTVVPQKQSCGDTLVPPPYKQHGKTQTGSHEIHSTDRLHRAQSGSLFLYIIFLTPLKK